MMEEPAKPFNQSGRMKINTRAVNQAVQSFNTGILWQG
jgi:hypothetical protein